MATGRNGDRKQQILQALAEMLENPQGEKITTAALARRLSVSEAALYRHFSGKAEMFESLIEFIENTVFTVINQIVEEEALGIRQAQAAAGVVLSFSETNQGMTRVMTGDALVNEDSRLQARMNQFYSRLEMSFRQSLRLAAVQGHCPEEQAAIRSNLLANFIIGKLSRFVKTQFKEKPTADMDMQVKIILT